MGTTIPTLPALPKLALPNLANVGVHSPLHPQLEYNCGEFTCADGSCPGPDGTCDNGSSGGCIFVCPDGSCGDTEPCGTFKTGSPFPPPGGIPTSGNSGSGSSGSSGGSSSGSPSGPCSTFFSMFQNPLACLLRLIFLILGIVCIIGAIYLFKPTSEIVAAPIRAAREGIRSATEASAGAAAVAA